MNKKRRCSYCRAYIDATAGVEINGTFFCGISHAIAKARGKTETDRAKKLAAGKKAQGKADTEKRKELMTRAQWYKRLERLVNQYVRWRDRDEPCCTCGTRAPGIKYDAGHFHTVAARPDIRFELTNIHKQCSMQCNQHGAGKSREYEIFIAEKYGAEHVEFLKMQQRPLHEVFPNWQDIEAEILRYRALIRSVGMTPAR